MTTVYQFINDLKDMKENVYSKAIMMGKINAKYENIKMLDMEAIDFDNLKDGYNVVVRIFDRFKKSDFFDVDIYVVIKNNKDDKIVLSISNINKGWRGNINIHGFNIVKQDEIICVGRDIEEIKDYIKNRKDNNNIFLDILAEKIRNFDVVNPDEIVNYFFNLFTVQKRRE